MKKREGEGRRRSAGLAHRPAVPALVLFWRASQDLVATGSRGWPEGCSARLLAPGRPGRRILRAWRSARRYRQPTGTKGVELMNVNKVANDCSISALYPLDTEVAQAGTASSAAAGSTSADISSFASAMSALQQLSQSDPAQFQEVTGQIASALQADAAKATGSQAQFLTGLADKFQQASQTGSMASLEPASPRAEGHHHHHRGVKSYGTQQSASTGDASDGAQGARDSTQQSPLDLAQIIESAMQSGGASAA